MQRSLYSKFFKANLAIIILIIICFSAGSFLILKNSYLRTQQREVLATASMFKEYYGQELARKDWKKLDQSIKKIAALTESRLTVILPDGTVVAESSAITAKMEKHFDRPEIIKSLQNQVGYSSRYSDTLKKKMLYVAIPYTQNGKIEVIIRASREYKEIQGVLMHILLIVCLLAGGVLLTALTMLLLISQNLSQPLLQINNFLKKMSQGNYERRSFIINNEDFQELANNLNNLAEHTHKTLTELSIQKEELKQIINSIQENLIIFDKNGLIKYTNQSFIKTFADKNILEGAYYWEFLRSPDIAETSKALNQNNTNLQREIEIDNRQYLASFTLIPENQDKLLLLTDITNNKSLDKLKKDFVVNVSHELRTPLTAIKGYLETLEEELPAEQVSYIKIIQKNTDRLIAIVQDLLLLSEIEETGFKINKEKVSIEKLIENIYNIFEQRVKDKGLNFSVQKEVLPQISGDAFKLEQVFINLIDNAVKYTEKGSIKINLSATPSKVIIKIQDSGIGIPLADQNRIFERFYVVDKSRSRKVGGTGLGLSIVKHIVLLHNGEIEFQSSPQNGTTFTITLPIN